MPPRDPLEVDIGKPRSATRRSSPGGAKSTSPLPQATQVAETATSWSRLGTRGLALLSLFSALSLTFYICFTYRILFHSDAAMKNLLADEIIRTHNLFPPDWYYVNEFPILFPDLAIVPLALLFPNSFALHAAACLIFAALFAYALYFLYDTSGLPGDTFLFTISLFFTGISSWFAENLFGQFAYGTAVASTFVLTALLFKTLQAFNSQGRRDILLWSGAFVCLLTILLASGIRGLLIFVIPMLGAMIVLTLFPDGSAVKGIFHLRSVLFMAGLMVMGICLGMMGFYLIRSHVHFQNAAAALRYVSFDRIESNVRAFILGFLGYTDALPDVGHGPMSVYGIVTAYRLFWFAIVLLLPFFLLFRYHRVASPHLLFLSLFYCLSLVTTLYVYVFSSVAENVATFRYFTIPAVVAIAIIGYAVHELRLRHGPKWFYLVVFACLPMYTGVFYHILVPYLQAGGAQHHQNTRQLLADYLVNHNLRYGYATFWNAGAVTVLSGERTHVNAIELPLVRPFWYLAPDHAFAPDTFVGETFLAVTDEEYTGLRRAYLDAYLGPPQSVESLPGYRVVTYGFNIAGRLPGWERPRDKLLINEKYSGDDLKAEVARGKAEEDLLHAGRPDVVVVSVTNRGHKPFASDGAFPIYLGIHLYSTDLQLKNFNYVLMALPRVLKAGETLEVPAILAPLPQGEYVLKVELVQGGVAWFGAKKDGQPLLIKLKVV